MKYTQLNILYYHGMNVQLGIYKLKKLASIGGCESEHYHHTKTLVDTKKSLL
jgi:hypothetical protein